VLLRPNQLYLALMDYLTTHLLVCTCHSIQVGLWHPVRSSHDKAAC